MLSNLKGDSEWKEIRTNVKSTIKSGNLKRNYYVLLFLTIPCLAISEQCQDGKLICSTGKRCCSLNGIETCCELIVEDEGSSNVLPLAKARYENFSNVSMITRPRRFADSNYPPCVPCPKGGCCPRDYTCCGDGCCQGRVVCCDKVCCRENESCCGKNCCAYGSLCCSTGVCCPHPGTCCPDGQCCPYPTICCRFGQCCPYAFTCCPSGQCCSYNERCCGENCCPS